MASSLTTTDRLLFTKSESSDHASHIKPRPVRTPRGLAFAKAGAAAIACRRPEERARWFFTSLAESVPLLTMSSGGSFWGPTGAALRVCYDGHAGRALPALLNRSYDCFQLDAAFPEFSALGQRMLEPGLVHRIVFEFRTEATAKPCLTQVGVARIQGLEDEGLSKVVLDEGTPLLGGVLFSSAGDVRSIGGGLEVFAPGGQAPGLSQRLEDWCSGGPSWLSGNSLISYVMLEVDLQQGQLAISVDESSKEPSRIFCPALLEGGTGEQYRPLVSLTAAGQEARIVDFHVLTSA